MSGLFVHPALLWGLALMALPVFIHLINLLRHRRVPWAAMEFLLVSQRKNSRWIRLRELLLLLARMAAVGLVCLVLAQPVLDDAWSRPFGAARVERLVLLDDSYSMADRWGNSTAFDLALAAIENQGRQLAESSVEQGYTLLRFSRAQSLGGHGAPDVSREIVDQAFPERLKSRLGEVRVSATAVGPAAALRAARHWREDVGLCDAVVTIVSDFRAREWDQPRDLLALLMELQNEGTRVELIAAVNSPRENLTLERLEPQAVTRAAGVSLAYDVSVLNQGREPVRDVSVAIEQDGVAAALVKFEAIAAGARETRSFQTSFPLAGPHLVTARLPADAVAIDNLRYSVLDLPASVATLVVARDVQGADARLLAAVLSPGGAVKTGVDVRVEPTAYLNNNELTGFEVIYLVDVDRLEEQAIKRLEAFVLAGGGAAFFLGPHTNVEFMNRNLHRAGQGVFPAPLLADVALAVNRLERAPDLLPSEHPVFRAFSGERSAFLDRITIERFMLTARDWQPPVDAGIEVIARLRGDKPLAIERTFGAGRVIAMFTTAGPAWNTWALDPSFVVTTLQLQSYLSRTSSLPTSRVVGEPFSVTLDPARYAPRATFVPPVESGVPAVAADLPTAAEGLVAQFPDTDYAGVYELQLIPRGGASERRQFAFNVDPREGELAIIDATGLATRLTGLNYEYHRAEQLAVAAGTTTASNLGDALLYLVVALLVGEQLLAWRASYHLPADLAGARR